MCKKKLQFLWISIILLAILFEFHSDLTWILLGFYPNLIGSYSNLIRVLLEILLSFYSNLIRIGTFMWNLSQVYMKSFASLCEIFCKLKKYMYLCIGFEKSPDGGIGRRAGLKHQCRKASRFEPGSGYYKSLVNRWFTRDFSFSTCTKSVLYNNVMRKVYFYVFSPLRFIFN